MTRVTCRLTAKNWDQLRNPMLGYRVWATFLWYSNWPTDIQRLFCTADDAGWRSLVRGAFWAAWTAQTSHQRVSVSTVGREGRRVSLWSLVRFTSSFCVNFNVRMTRAFFGCLEEFMKRSEQYWSFHVRKNRGSVRNSLCRRKEDGIKVFSLIPWFDQC